MTRIVLVEDNANLALGLRNNLEFEGYDVEVAADDLAGLERIRSAPADLVILDLMLPALDGYGVLLQMRADGIETPVLILTARGDEADKVRGFRSGADDYVTKPFGLMELLARVDALLRRSAGRATTAAPERAAFGTVRVDTATHTVTRDGQPVLLRPKEFELLVALLRRRGQVTTRLELLREVWEYDATVVSRTVDTHIAELRRKLEPDPANPRHILTVRKTGYQLEG